MRLNVLKETLSGFPHILGLVSPDSGAIDGGLIVDAVPVCRSRLCDWCWEAASALRPRSAVFIIANNSDGYGIDRCLATGANCGVAVATAYCRAREYAQAASFRRVERDEITGGVPTTNGSAARNEFVAIECLR